MGLRAGGTRPVARTPRGARRGDPQDRRRAQAPCSRADARRMLDRRHDKGARRQRGEPLPASAAWLEVATGDPPRILMDQVDRLLNEFVEAWNAGDRPEVDEFVDRAPEAERNELAGLIGAFLEIAPTPPYSPDQLRV